MEVREGKTVTPIAAAKESVVAVCKPVVHVDGVRWCENRGYQLAYCSSPT
jgi:hypothetical protein